MNDVCLECDCPATIVTAWGDWLCAWHMDHGPSTSLICPTCSQDATPAGLPVAVMSDRPGDATDAVPPRTASVAPISPVVVLPPEAATGDPYSWANMVQALTWCVNRAYDSKDAPTGVIEAADAGLTVFERVARAVQGTS